MVASLRSLLTSFYLGVMLCVVYALEPVVTLMIWSWIVLNLFNLVEAARLDLMFFYTDFPFTNNLFLFMLVVFLKKR